jgi:hypothetical protein
MVWHIFKKDWKLLWPFFLAVAATQFIPSIIRLKLGLFGENRALQELLDLFGVIAFVGSAFLIAAVVHQDSIPGVRQDWLVRPIRRGDLLLAKFSFVLVLAQGPFFVADLLQALASGFPLRQSLVAAISRALVLLLSFTLPVFAFASLTQNSSEAIVGGVAFFFLFFVFQMLANAVYGSSGYLDPAGGYRGAVGNRFHKVPCASVGGKHYFGSPVSPSKDGVKPLAGCDCFRLVHARRVSAVEVRVCL